MLFSLALLPQSNPAQLNLPGAQAPAIITLEVPRAHKPPRHDKAQHLGREEIFTLLKCFCFFLNAKPLDWLLVNLRLLPRPLSIISGSSSSIVDIITFLLDYCLWCFCVQVFQSTVVQYGSMVWATFLSFHCSKKSWDKHQWLLRVCSNAHFLNL